MKFLRYLNEENIVQKALKMDEPIKGAIMDIKKVENLLDILSKARDSIEGKVVDVPETTDEKLTQAQYDDIMDKLVKWQEVYDKLKGNEEAPEEDETEE